MELKSDDCLCGLSAPGKWRCTIEHDRVRYQAVANRIGKRVETWALAYASPRPQQPSVKMPEELAVESIRDEIIRLSYASFD